MPLITPAPSEAPDLPLLRLRKLIADAGPSLVAFSGGVDSALVLKVAREELGEDVVALTALSPTLPSEEYDDARRIASLMGVRHELLESNEMEVEGFRTNPQNRCYYCKTELYTLCLEAASRWGISSILDGVNQDDLSDWRPGLKAAEEKGVRHPLVEAGFTKAMVREAARALHLDVWDKPAFACLSSRIPYGTEITLPRLERVGAVESLLRRLGFRVFRVRHHENLARIEVGEAEVDRLFEPEIRRQVVTLSKEVGFLYVTLDMEGYRTGSLNASLPVLSS